MIRFTVWRSDSRYRGFESRGHAGYADAGEDIICAAVSALTVNALNSIEQLTEDDFETEMAGDGGYLRISFPGNPGPEATLLLDSLVLGIRSIQAEYGNEYITLIVEEV